MLPIFESILPIFLLVLLGVALKRTTLFDASFWPGLETLGYYVLFPALLFLTLATADFSGFRLGVISLVALGAVIVMTVLLLALYPLVRLRGVTDASYTSVFQTALRWNAFIALAIAERIAGLEGLALVALVMAVIIIPLNLINVGILIWFGGGHRSFVSFFRRLATNPLILSSVAGLIYNALPFGLYPPIEQSIDLIARSSLGFGLLIVGGALRLSDAVKSGPSVLLASALKLVVFPLVMAGLALMAGISGQTLVLLVLCACVPTAMNGYLLARQMGGDAPLYAAVVTMQTAASFLTMPAMLAMAGAFS